MEPPLLELVVWLKETPPVDEDKVALAVCVPFVTPRCHFCDVMESSPTLEMELNCWSPSSMVTVAGLLSRSASESRRSDMRR